MLERRGSLICPQNVPWKRGRVFSRTQRMSMAQLRRVLLPMKLVDSGSPFVGLCDTSLQTVSGLQPLVGKVNKRT